MVKPEGARFLESRGLTPWVKICGTTSLEDAMAAVEAGADALGFIFVPSSPRVITREIAAEILAALPPTVLTVGVVADEDPDFIRGLLRVCPFRAIQFHGKESPEQVLSFKRKVKLIKAIRVKDGDSLKIIPAYQGVDAILLDTHLSSAPVQELPGKRGQEPASQQAQRLPSQEGQGSSGQGQGPPPSGGSSPLGGTGVPFDWRLASQAKAFGIPIIVAGGLNPTNVSQVVREVHPFGVDVSSGVESSPGRKDPELVRAFIVRAKSTD